jgi:hypothetical protein
LAERPDDHAEGWGYYRILQAAAALLANWSIRRRLRNKGQFVLHSTTIRNMLKPKQFLRSWPLPLLMP